MECSPHLKLWLVALDAILKNYDRGRVEREIYVVRGLESRAEKAYGEHNRLGCFYTGRIRCLGYGRERMSDCTWYGPRGISEYFECRKASAVKRDRKKERKNI